MIYQSEEYNKKENLKVKRNNYSKEKYLDDVKIYECIGIKLFLKVSRCVRVN